MEGYDPAIHVRASGRELNISPKAAREICNTLKGMTLSKAIELTETVEAMKAPVAFRRHKKKVGHRSELVGFPTGSYPVKAAGKNRSTVFFWPKFALNLTSTNPVSFLDLRVKSGAFEPTLIAINFIISNLRFPTNLLSVL